MDRRRFVKTAAAAGTALSAGPFLGRVSGANERLAVGAIGCGGMGKANIRDFLRTEGVDVAAVCDVYQAHLEQAVELTDGKATPFKDYRKLLERKDLDAVIVSTPDHWHALQAIHACQAGKDVYVEKPLSLTIGEGRRMVEAARAHDRVVQVGTQQRSGEYFQQAVELVRKGALGKVTSVRTWNYGNQAPSGIGKPPDSEPLPGLDWDLWLGPAPAVPYNRNRCLFNFRWFWDYSGGMLTDWGTHLVDVVHWAMEVDAPLTAYAVGGKYALDDNRETPDTLEVVYEYPGFVFTYSHRAANGRGPDGKSYGIQFFGTRGSLFVDRGGFELSPDRSSDEAAPPPEKGARSDSSAQHLPHVKNFVECVKSRKRPASDVEIGHRSTSACHVGNIAYKLGRKLKWDGARETARDDAEANTLLTKAYRKPWTL